MKLINLTPHPIHILGEDNQIIRTIESSGIVRLKTSTVITGEVVDGITITTTIFGEPEGLPELEQSTCLGNCRGEYDEGGFACPWFNGEKSGCGLGHNRPKRYYIVSQMVKSALPNRKDLLVPADVVRDKQGNILGCKTLGI